jgi:hypothetical protein
MPKTTAVASGLELTSPPKGAQIEELEDRPQLPAEDAIQEAREPLSAVEDVPVSYLSLGAAERASAEVPANIERPEQDSNLRPTP